MKIEGFGLLHLRKTQELKGDDYYKNQLWVAPEIIRSNMTVLGSQKGDVFSFSIVAYEILFRLLPYYANEITCKGLNFIFLKLKKNITTFFKLQKLLKK